MDSLNRLCAYGGLPRALPGPPTTMFSFTDRSTGSTRQDSVAMFARLFSMNTILYESDIQRLSIRKL